MRRALWPLLLLTCSVAAAQSTPEALALALQDAARRGDAAAYRALLFPAGTFAVEGANFAADLARVPQPSVTYRFINLKVNGLQATARLSMNWLRQPERPVRLSFPVRLQQVNGTWRYAGEDFQPIPAGKYTLLALNEPGLPAKSASIGGLLGQAAQRVNEVLNLVVPPSVTIKVYPDMPTLSASVALSLQPVSGWNEPGEAIKLVLPGGVNAQNETLRVLAHEFTHLGVSQAAGSGLDKRLPWWLHEGLADFVARAYWTPESVKARQSRIKGYAQTDWVPLAELFDFNAVPESRWPYVYAQGLGVVDFLSSTVSPDGPMKLALAYAALNDADGAARTVGFPTFSDLEQAARDWLAGR